MKIFSKIISSFLLFFELLKNFFSFFYFGFKNDSIKNTFNNAERIIFKHFTSLSDSLKTNYSNSLNSQAKSLYREKCKSLHADFSPSPTFSYSILIPVYKPKANYFETAIRSCLNQTAPNYEILIGFDGPQPDSVYLVVEKLQKEFGDIIKSFSIDRSLSGGGISATTNYLANKAKGNFLLLMDHDDWISPDLIYRYEQMLRLIKNQAELDYTVLYCDEYKINEKDQYIDGSELRKGNRPHFPYLFINSICHCLLIPKTLWDKINGCRRECDFAQDFDLALRLESNGAKFHNVPFLLYAWRAHSQSTAMNPNQKSGAEQSTLKSLQDYTFQKKLNWKLETGNIPTSCRAIPELYFKKVVHVIIPIEEGNAGILETVHALLNQIEIPVKITLVVNTTQSLIDETKLAASGCEIFRVKGNVVSSHNKNRAVYESHYKSECELILFLNSQVILNQDALLEMCRWIEQPLIGIVGCRLNYCDGTPAHQGMEFDIFGPSHSMSWNQTGLPLGAFLRVVDAVTVDCALISKDNFLDVNGFEEIGYPLKNQDTYLATKLRKRQLFSFFTPYAIGTYQNKPSSHSCDNLIDSSCWLFDKVNQGSTLS